MSDQRYDPMDFDTWPQEQIDALARVGDGIGDGDLKPLADYLRHYQVIPELVGAWIADAIEGHPSMPFRIMAIGQKRRPQGWTEGSEIHARKMRIGIAAERAVRAVVGERRSKAAIGQVMNEFGVSRTSATDYRRYALKHIAEVSEREGRDMWQYYNELFGEEDRV